MNATPAGRIVTKIVFPVLDLAVAESFYRSLGFEVEVYDGSYAWVRHQGEEILHLSLISDLDRNANRAAGYWHVQDAAAVHRAWSATGAELGPVEDQPWRMREFSFRDPDNNLLRVGQNL